MVGLIADLLGAHFGVFIVTLLVGHWFFKSDPPLERSLKTTAVAVVFACLVSGYTFADGGPFTLKMFPVYVSTFPLVAYAYFRRLSARWTED